ncbi:MAG: creatininase family protein [bacterium]
MESAPQLIARVARLILPTLPLLPGAARSVVTTGVGSSAAHAALLAHLLADQLGIAARAVPAGAFIAPLADSARDVLVVFSQGLSPNARLALHDPQRWLAVILVTAVAPRPRDTARREALAALRRAGGVVMHLPGGAERGLLLRVAGPLAASAACFRLADALATTLRGAAATDAALRLDAARIASAMRAAATRGAAFARRRDRADRLPQALLASGGYGAIAGNLALKLSEALLVPPPPVHDLIDFAHGPFQHLFAAPATLFALTRRNAPGEDALWARLTAMLDAPRHRVVRLPSTLPGAQALFEHESWLNAFVLEVIEAAERDPADWPGRGNDAPLYDVAAPFAPRRVAPRHTRPTDSLAALTWPELARARAAGCDTAVVPLGATEQHGPHLPFATDTWIAEALAARFCTRVPQAVAVPALPFGCSAEHGEFAGTLSLGWDTLRALLADLCAALARGGFARIVVFSAHGGNDALLAASASQLSRAARPARLIICRDIAVLAAGWHRASAAFGVTPAAAGYHAGEFETSLIAGLRPEALRRNALRAGLSRVRGDAQRLFYPSLRRRAPSGVVGDPRGATASRAAAYLDAWVEALVAQYRGAMKRQTTKGIHRP